VAKKPPPEILELDGVEVKVSSPNKVYFPDLGLTKLDLVKYYLAVSEGALRGVRDRPVVLKRYVRGISADFFFQKRAPAKRPDWIDVATFHYPSGRSADEVVVSRRAHLAWLVNLGCIDLNPHSVRADDLDHPDELRVDLDPGPGVSWDTVRRVAMVVRECLDDHGLIGWPKTSGSRGIHINVRIARQWAFSDVRRAAEALARDVERRAPELATSRWFKEQRHGVFVDYNQNAGDRTVASAYSVRPVANAQVSAPITWDELPTCELADFTVATMPERYAERGDLSDGIDAAVGSIASLLDLAGEYEAEGPREALEFPLLVIAKAAKKPDAIAGLDRWRQRHPKVAGYLEVEDVLVDAMRGRSTMWTRIRVNLRNVPEELRPAQETPEPDYDPWTSRSEP
jgi:bifunctional non-homologous end joining protein LigD